MTMKRLFLKIRSMRFIKCRDGVAAAEFGLMVPVFAICLLGMIDAGLAINERMTLDRVLRAGAQLAMSGVDDVSELESSVINSSESQGENESPPSLDTVDYTLSIIRTCECGGAAGTCTARCGNGDVPSTFYDFKATQTMDTMILPHFDVESNIRVQVR